MLMRVSVPLSVYCWSTFTVKRFSKDHLPLTKESPRDGPLHWGHGVYVVQLFHCCHLVLFDMARLDTLLPVGFGGVTADFVNNFSTGIMVPWLLGMLVGSVPA